MQTYLIVSRDKNFITGRIDKLKKQYAISPFNLHEISPMPSIGIEEIRSLSKIFSLKPYGSKNRLVVIFNMEKATVEAQNALLKILEEPPADTYLLLTCESKEILLPTIPSRCLIITQTGGGSDSANMEKTEKLLREILTASPGKRIILAQSRAKTKEEARSLLDAIISLLEKFLHQPPENWPISLKATAHCLAKTIAAQKYIERNINFKATLDILLLGFPKIQ